LAVLTKKGVSLAKHDLALQQITIRTRTTLP